MGFARNYISDSSITRFPEFGATCQIFLRMMINYLFQLSKPARMWLTVQHRGISSIDLAWLVWDNHLSCEASCFHPWVLFAVTSHMTTTNIFDRQVLFFFEEEEEIFIHQPLTNQGLHWWQQKQDMPCSYTEPWRPQATLWTEPATCFCSNACHVTFSLVSWPFSPHLIIPTLETWYTESRQW